MQTRVLPTQKVMHDKIANDVDIEDVDDIDNVDDIGMRMPTLITIRRCVTAPERVQVNFLHHVAFDILRFPRDQLWMLVPFFPHR